MCVCGYTEYVNESHIGVKSFIWHWLDTIIITALLLSRTNTPNRMPFCTQKIFILRWFASKKGFNLIKYIYGGKYIETMRINTFSVAYLTFCNILINPLYLVYAVDENEDKLAVYEMWNSFLWWGFETFCANHMAGIWQKRFSIYSRLNWCSDEVCRTHKFSLFSLIWYRSSTVWNIFLRRFT